MSFHVKLHVLNWPGISGSKRFASLALHTCTHTSPPQIAMSEAPNLGNLAEQLQKLAVSMKEIHDQNEEAKGRMTRLEAANVTFQQQLSAQQQELIALRTAPQLALPNEQLDNPTAHLLAITEGEGETKEVARRVLADETLDTPMTKRDFKLLLESASARSYRRSSL